jgi:voltage-gated potassium channel
MTSTTPHSKDSLRHRLFVIIFGTNTRAGRLFDLWLLWLILASILVVCLESVPSLRSQAGRVFWALELAFTGIFTVEFILRLYCHPKPLRYFFSFYGFVDLLSILPTYLLYWGPGYPLFSDDTSRAAVARISNFEAECLCPTCRRVA